MQIDKIPVGDNPPESLNVIIEVPTGGEPVKYEFDKASGALFVDRILHTAMRYPANYGFIPHTLGEDGDPLDCLVMNRWPFMPGCVVRARPVAVLFLEDEAGGDDGGGDLGVAECAHALIEACAGRWRPELRMDSSAATES